MIAPTAPHLRRSPLQGRPAVSSLLLLALLFCEAGCSHFRALTNSSDSEAQRLAEQARQAEHRGDSHAAEMLFAAAVRRNPRDCEARLELSRQLIEHGSLEAAVDHLKQIITQSPDDPRGYIRLAQTYYYQERYLDADRVLRTALELDPAQPEALILLGRLNQIRHRDDEALAAYYRVLETDPSHAEAHLLIAEIQLERRRPQQAAATLRHVIADARACPRTRAEASWLLGQTLAQQHDWSGAAAALAAASEQRSMTPADWQLLAEARTQAGLPEVAASRGPGPAKLDSPLDGAPLVQAGHLRPH